MIRLAALIALLASPVMATEVCAPREALVAKLAETWDESQRAFGIGPGHIIEVWASDAGTWTVMRTMPTGVTCVIATGVAYQDTSEPKGDKL